jgi:hypothetical protein
MCAIVAFDLHSAPDWAGEKAARQLQPIISRECNHGSLCFSPNESCHGPAAPLCMPPVNSTWETYRSVTQVHMCACVLLRLSNHDCDCDRESVTATVHDQQTAAIGTGSPE